MMRKPLVALLALSLAFPMTAWASTAVAAEGSAPSAAQLSFDRASFCKDATIEETVLVDENGIKITAKELVYEDYEARLMLVIENNTDKNLEFIANSGSYSCNSVNGYMIPDGYMSCDVSAGKKAIESIDLSYREMMAPYGIYEIAEIGVGFLVCDDDYNYTYLAPKTVTTSVAEGLGHDAPSYQDVVASEAAQAEFEYSLAHFATDVVYENNGLAVVSQVLTKNSEGETTLLLEVANNTSEVVEVAVSDIRVNGLCICDSTWSHDAIIPGKTAIVSIRLASILEQEYLEAFGIGEIGDVSLGVSFENVNGEEIAVPAYLTVDVPGVDAPFSMDGAEVYNANGLRIVSKGVVADPHTYSDNMTLLLAAENTSGRALTIGYDYGSFSINDFMTDCSFYSATVKDGTYAAIEITLWDYNLEDIYITDPSEIQTIGIGLKIRDENYGLVDERPVSFSVV